MVLMLATGCAFFEDEEIIVPVTNTEYFDEKVTAVADSLSANTTKRVNRAAVLPFANPDGSISQLGRYLSTKLGTVAVRRQLFTMPSHGEVEKAMDAEQIKYNGTLDGESARKLGGALNVDTLVVGVISDLQKGSDIDLLVSMIDVRSGHVISAANTSIIRSKSVSTMMKNR